MLLTAVLGGVAAGCGPREAGGDLPVPVIHSPADASVMGPSASGDGNRLAWWQQDGTDVQLWIGDADLANARPTGIRESAPTSLAWSAAGDRLAVAAVSDDAGPGVIIVPVDSVNGARRVVTPFVGPIQWFPGDERLLLHIGVDRDRFRMAVLTLATGEIAPVFPAENRSHFGALSPDGRALAYLLLEPQADGESRSTIWVVDSLGGVPRALTTEGVESLISASGAIWSPDGTQLLFSSRRTGRSDLWIAEVASGRLRQLTRDIRDDVAGFWSPDGARIAFESTRGGQADLWVVAAEGGEPERLTNDLDGEWFIAWRDNRRVSYITGRGEGGVWEARIADGTLRRLTADSLRILELRQSRDRSQLLLQVDRGGGTSELWRMPATGGALELVFGGDAVVNDAAWSPGDTLVAIASRQAGVPRVAVVDMRSGAERTVPDVPGDKIEVRWSSDGTALWVVAAQRFGIETVLWRVPLDGAPPRAAASGGLRESFVVPQQGTEDLVLATRFDFSTGMFSVVAVTAESELRTFVAGAWLPNDDAALSRGDSVNVWLERPVDGHRNRLVSIASGKGRGMLTADDYALNLSADGRFVSFQRRRGNTIGVGVHDLNTGETRMLTETPFRDRYGRFTADGEHLLILRQADIRRVAELDVGERGRTKQ